MRITARTLGVVAVLFGLLATGPAPVLAFPPLPSGVYGTVSLNGADLADGTLVQAIIDDQVFAFTLTQTYQGDSVYSLDIPGDDLATDRVEGGKDGDTISFRVAGILAGQTGVWRSGTNVGLNLTASSTSTPLPPQPSRTPLPTQTVLPPAPTRAAATPTRIADVPTREQPAQTAEPMQAPAAVVHSPTAQYATGGPEPAAGLSPAPEPQPAATGSATQPTGSARTSIPAGAPSPAVFAANTRQSASVGETDAIRETGSLSLWWIVIPLVVVLSGVVGFGYVANRNRNSKR